MMKNAAMTETTDTSMATAMARVTTMAIAMARAAMIRTTTRMMVATDQNNGNGGHYYECSPGREMR